MAKRSRQFTFGDALLSVMEKQAIAREQRKQFDEQMAEQRYQFDENKSLQNKQLTVAMDQLQLQQKEDIRQEKESNQKDTLFKLQTQPYSLKTYKESLVKHPILQSWLGGAADKDGMISPVQHKQIMSDYIDLLNADNKQAYQQTMLALRGGVHTAAQIAGEEKRKAALLLGEASTILKPITEYTPSKLDLVKESRKANEGTFSQSVGDAIDILSLKPSVRSGNPFSMLRTEESLDRARLNIQAKQDPTPSAKPNIEPVLGGLYNLLENSLKGPVDSKTGLRTGGSPLDLGVANYLKGQMVLIKNQLSDDPSDIMRKRVKSIEDLLDVPTAGLREKSSVTQQDIMFRQMIKDNPELLQPPQ